MNNDTTQPCTRCDGEGSIHTGIDEAPTTQCPKCDGAGSTQPREQAAIDRSKLQRFNMRGGLMNPEPWGLYVRHEDVAALLDTVAAPEAPILHKAVHFYRRSPDENWRETTAEHVAHLKKYPGFLYRTLYEPTGAAPLMPEVAASEQQVCAPNCFYGDCPPCVAAGLVPAAATTASASGTCPACVEDGGACSNPEECGAVMTAFGRATAPSRNAAPEVKTWQERIVSGAFHPDPLPSGESVMVYTGASAAIAARDAEITDLRAALTQQSAAQAPSQEADVILRELVDLRKLKAGYETVPHMHHVWWMREKLADYEARWPAAWDRATAYASNAAIDAAMSAATEQGEKP